MLGTLRKQSRSVIIYVLFGIIIVVFVFTFNVASPDAGCAGAGTSSRATTLATVGDVRLDVSDLTMGMALSADPPPLGAAADPRAFQMEWLYRTTRFARLRGGDTRYLRYGPDPSRVSPIKARKVADDLIETYLVSEEARRLGLRAADHEVRDRLVSEFTDSDGQFRKGQYENWVRYGLKTSLGRFEDFVRREILRERMIDLLTAQVAVPEREARLVARLRAAKREYEYLEINPEPLARALPVGGEEVAAFLATREADARKYYEEHASEFRIEPRYDFHLAKFSAASKKMMGLVTDDEQRKALQESWADAKTRAERAAGRLKGQSGDSLVAAFEAMAREMSDHSATRERGGRVESPWPESGLSLLDGVVASALASLEPGTASDPVAADDGYYLLLLRERVPGRDRPFEEVREDIARRLLQDEKVAGTLDAAVAATLAAARRDPTRSLRDVASEVNAPYAPQSPIRYGETGGVPATPSSLADLADWNADSVPGLGASKELAQALRDLTPERPLADRVFQVEGSSSRYVVRLKGETQAPTDPDPKAVEAARNELLTLKRLAWYREWYDELRRRAAAEGRLVEHEALTRLIQEEIRSLEEARKAAEKTEAR